MLLVGNSPLSEAKQVGILYRFQDVRSMKELLRTNTLSAISGIICLTRNKNHPSGQIRVGLVLDGDKLSNTYKITPYSNEGDDPKFYEQEERINRSINEISRYIIECTIPRIMLSKRFSFLNSGYESCSEMIKDIESKHIKITYRD